jgi:hypothetical protein
MKYEKTLAFALLASMAYVAQSEEVELGPSEGGEDGNWLKLENHDPDQTTKVKVDISQSFTETSEIVDTKTTLCFHTDDTHEVQDGADAFGIQWMCMAPTCDSNHDFRVNIFASTAHQDATTGHLWFTSTEDDYSAWTYLGPEDRLNRCTGGEDDASDCEDDDTLDLNMRLRADADDYDRSNLPTWGEETHLKCFTEMDGDWYNTNFLAGINTDGWESFDVTLWEEPEEEQQEDEGDNQDDGSGENQDDGSGDNAEDNSGEDTGDNTEDNSGDNAEDNSGEEGGEEQNPEEEADQAEENAEDAAESAEDAAENAGDAIEEGAEEAVEEGAEEVIDEVNEPGRR